MRTLYIDVYFLINFSVDILALYIATRFMKVRSSVGRMLIGAVIGAGYAIAAFFFGDRTSFIFLLSLPTWFLTVWLCTPGCSFSRRVRFFAAFMFSQILLAGLVHYGYGLLTRLGIGKGTIEGGTQSRKFLLLAMMILLAIGLLRLGQAILSGAPDAHYIVTVCIFADGKRQTIDALVDSGNLLRDPLDGRPVMLLKARAAEKIFPDADAVLADADTDRRTARRVRLIPMKRGRDTIVLTGVRPDRVTVSVKGRQTEVDLMIAIDKEEGTFGGCDALLPTAVLSHGI